MNVVTRYAARILPRALDEDGARDPPVSVTVAIEVHDVVVYERLEFASTDVLSIERRQLIAALATQPRFAASREVVNAQNGVGGEQVDDAVDIGVHGRVAVQ